MKTITEMINERRRSRLSSRRTVLREANERGLFAGIRSRAGKPMGRAEATIAAADSANGKDPFYNCAVPPHWHRLFKRIFVKAAVHAAHTENRVTAR